MLDINDIQALELADAMYSPQDFGPIVDRFEIVRRRLAPVQVLVDWVQERRRRLAKEAQYGLSYPFYDSDRLSIIE